MWHLIPSVDFLLKLYSSVCVQQKKVKDPGAPKRPMSGYMLWLNGNRERIKSENPGISVTEISKKAGEMWKLLGKDRKEVSDTHTHTWNLKVLTLL